MVGYQLKVDAPLGNYSIGNEFNINYNYIRKTYSGGPETLGDNSIAHGTQIVVSLGKLKVEVIAAKNGPYFTTNIYYDGELEATSGEYSDWGRTSIAKSSAEWNALFSGTKTDGENYDGEINRAFDVSANYSDGDMIDSPVSITYNNGTVTVVEGSKEVTATIENADFSDADLSVSIATKQNKATVVYGFSGTFTPADPAGKLLPDGAFLTVNDSLAIDFAYESGKLNGLAAAGYSNVTATATVADHPELNKTFALGDATAIGGYDCFVLDTLTPDLFGTTVTLTVNATYNSKPISADFEYSVKEYCVSTISKPTDAVYTDELKTLCYSILEYGEAVRLWKLSEGKSAPATSITDGVDTTYNPTAWDVTAASNTAAKTDEGTDAVWGGMNLNLADNVGLNLYFTINNGTLGDYDVEADNSKSASFGPSVGDEHCAVVRIFAYNMENPVTAYITKSGERVSKKYVVSVKDYVVYAIKNNKFTDDAKTCAIALMTYGAAAYEYAF